jgi:hypothetical protein
MRVTPGIEEDQVPGLRPEDGAGLIHLSHGGGTVVMREHKLPTRAQRMI